MSEPTVGRTFEIDQSAIRTFLSSLPATWLARQQLPDLHIDFVVELTEAGELTGIVLGAQIKGYRPSTASQLRLKHMISTKHLAYFVDKVTYPVFLFLVDASTGTILYRFMQEFGKEVGKSWRSQKSLTADFTEQENFADQLRFTSDLMSAVQFTRN